MQCDQVQIGPHFNAISPVMDSVPGKWPAIWEDVFEGHGQWLESTLPRLKVDAVVGARAMKIPGSFPL